MKIFIFGGSPLRGPGTQKLGDPECPQIFLESTCIYPSKNHKENLPLQLSLFNSIPLHLWIEKEEKVKKMENEQKWAYAFMAITQLVLYRFKNMMQQKQF